jgi:hypothetical protein
LREHRRSLGSITPLFRKHKTSMGVPCLSFACLFGGNLVDPRLRASNVSHTLNDPSKLACFTLPGMAPVLVPLRPSSEHILIVRAPGARDQHGCHSTLPSCAFREQKDDQAGWVEHRVRSVPPEYKDNNHESFHDKSSCVELNFLLGCGSKYLESKIKTFAYDFLQKSETFDTIFQGYIPCYTNYSWFGWLVALR